MYNTISYKLKKIKQILNKKQFFKKQLFIKKLFKKVQLYEFNDLDLDTRLIAWNNIEDKLYIKAKTKFEREINNMNYFPHSNITYLYDYKEKPCCVGLKGNFSIIDIEKLTNTRFTNLELLMIELKGKQINIDIEPGIKRYTILWDKMLCFDYVMDDDIINDNSKIYYSEVEIDEAVMNLSICGAKLTEQCNNICDKLEEISYDIFYNLFHSDKFLRLALYDKQGNFIKWKRRYRINLLK